MKIFTNAQIATLAGNDSFGMIAQGVIVVEGRKIAWLGTAKDLPDVYQSGETVNLEGRLVTPALIDCHSQVTCFATFTSVHYLK